MQKLDRLYQETARDAQTQVAAWLTKYAESRFLTIEETWKLVSRFEMSEFARHVQDLMSKEELMSEAIKRLELYNLKMR